MGCFCLEANQLVDRLITGLKVIKLFSSSAQLSMKFQLRINVEIVNLVETSGLKLKKLVIYPAHKC